MSLSATTPQDTLMLVGFIVLFSAATCPFIFIKGEWFGSILYSQATHFSIKRRSGLRAEYDSSDFRNGPRPLPCPSPEGASPAVSKQHLVATPV